MEKVTIFNDAERKALASAAVAIKRLTETAEAEGNENLYLFLAELDAFTQSTDDIVCGMTDAVTESDFWRNKDAIGSWAISNTIAVELLEADGDEAVVREPSGEISRHELKYTLDDTDEHEAGTAYIKLGEIELYFDECMRINL